jgi:cobalt-zinc-cadmium efflux system outer membrane protein
VSLIGGTKKTSGFDGIVFGAALPFPLFSVNGGARQKAQGDLMQAQAELRDATARVAADVMATRTALAAQQGAAGIRPDSLAARGAEVATIAEAAYREGALSQLELLEARKASAEARAAALRWLVDQQLTRLDFKRAIGAPVMEAQP